MVLAPEDVYLGCHERRCPCDETKRTVRSRAYLPLDDLFSAMSVNQGHDRPSRIHFRQKREAQPSGLLRASTVQVVAVQGLVTIVRVDREGMHM